MRLRHKESSFLSHYDQGIIIHLRNPGDLQESLVSIRILENIVGIYNRANSIINDIESDNEAAIVAKYIIGKGPF